LQWLSILDGFGMTGRMKENCGLALETHVVNMIKISLRQQRRLLSKMAKNAKFWVSSWLDGMRPKDIAPLIHGISVGKNATVYKALSNDSWIHKINLQHGLSTEHISQFIALWGKMNHVQLNHDVADSIVWKFTGDGSYSFKTAYAAQFLALTTSAMPKWVWKQWAPPKCKCSLG
jgi:hypothetical protein